MQSVLTSKFLKDVFMCSLVAFGGPEATPRSFFGQDGTKKEISFGKGIT